MTLDRHGTKRCYPMGRVLLIDVDACCVFKQQSNRCLVALTSSMSQGRQAGRAQGPIDIKVDPDINAAISGSITLGRSVANLPSPSVSIQAISARCPSLASLASLDLTGCHKVSNAGI